MPARGFSGWLLTACLMAGTAVPALPSSVDDLAAKAQKGREAMAAGRFEEAAALYAEITRALPKEPGMLLNLGMALSMAGRPREAARSPGDSCRHRCARPHANGPLSPVSGHGR